MTRIKMFNQSISVLGSNDLMQTNVYITDKICNWLCLTLIVMNWFSWNLVIIYDCITIQLYIQIIQVLKWICLMMINEMISPKRIQSFAWYIALFFSYKFCMTVFRLPNIVDVRSKLPIWVNFKFDYKIHTWIRPYELFSPSIQDSLAKQG